MSKQRSAEIIYPVFNKIPHEYHLEPAEVVYACRSGVPCGKHVFRGIGYMALLDKFKYRPSLPWEEVGYMIPKDEYKNFSTDS